MRRRLGGILVGATVVALLTVVAPAAHAAAPANDHLANAAVIAGGGSAVGTLMESTFEAEEEAATGATPAPGLPNWGTVWYAYTPANNVTATIRADGRDSFQSKLNVFTGNSYSNLSLVSGGHSCPGGEFPFQNGGCETFAAAQGTTYLIQVVNQNTNFSEVFDLSVAEEGVGSISGTVQNEAGAPVGDVCVKSYNNAGTFHAQTTSAANGTYTVAAPSGPANKVEFSDCNKTTQVFTEWHNDKSSQATADPITVPAGGNQPIGTTTLQRGVRISGTVTGPDGVTPLANVCAIPIAATTNSENFSVITGADGKYTALIAADTYKVQFRHCVFPPEYASEWYADKPDQTAATALDLEAGESVTADASLAAGGTIAGTLNYTDPPASGGVCIEAHPVGGGGVVMSGGLSIAATETTYAITGLGTGSYRLKMYACGFTNGPPVWYPLKRSFATGESVAVTSGTTTTLPLTFGNLTSIGVRAETPAGTAIPGVCVDLYDADDSGLHFGSATTNASGEAKFSGLTAGNYKAKLTDCDNSGFSGPVWFDSKAGFATANVVAGYWPASPTDFVTVTQKLASPTTAPAPPALDATNPASGANDNDPEVIGTAAAGSTVQLYTDSTCTSPIGSSASAATFASPGITVNVADNSTTTFYATATNSVGTSSCSADSITYAEVSALDSTPPDATPPGDTPPDGTPPTTRDNSACEAAQAKLAAANKKKQKAIAALEAAVAKEKPRAKIKKLKRKAKAAKKAAKKAAADVATACA